MVIYDQRNHLSPSLLYCTVCLIGRTEPPLLCDILSVIINVRIQLTRTGHHVVASFIHHMSYDMTIGILISITSVTNQICSIVLPPPNETSRQVF